MIRLDDKQDWRAAAEAGTAEPMLKFELEATEAFDELHDNTDWWNEGRNDDLDTAHPAGELRLARTRETVHPEA